MKIKQLHYFSGLFISVFVALHLFNHLYSLIGIEAHIKMMDNLRLIYRNIFVESLLLIAVLVQIISGIRLFRVKRKIASRFFEKLQIWTGLYLAFFFLAHVSAVLGGRFVLNLDTNIYFGAAGLNAFPHNLFFIPYYGLAILAFFGHVAAIHSQKMKKSILGFSPAQQSNFILIKGIIITVVIFYGLTNGFNGILLPEEYNIMIGK